MIAQAQPGSAGDGRYTEGILLALGAAFFYAVAALVAKRLKGMPPQLIVMVQMLAGAILLLPLQLGGGAPVAPSVWPILVNIRPVCTTPMVTLMYSAIQRLPTYLAGALSFIYPVVAFIVDAWAFGHRMQPTQLLGACAILLSAAAMMLGSLKQPALAPR